MIVRKIINYIVSDPRAVLYSAVGVGGIDAFAGAQSFDLKTSLVGLVGGLMTTGIALYEAAGIDEERNLDNQTQMDKYHKTNKVKA